METKFKSQICTTREQSERLLALGLKKETADMNYTRLSRGDNWTLFIGKPLGYEEIPTEYLLPAWSLHRLIDMMPREIVIINAEHMSKEFSLRMRGSCVYYENMQGWRCITQGGGLYIGIINCIEWLIKEGYFNKEYLV